MENFSKEIDTCSLQIATETENYIHWNNRGFYKMCQAIYEQDINLLKESITDFELAIKYCSAIHPNKIYFIAESNIQEAKTRKQNWVYCNCK